jgi:hypothetical protein
MLTEDRVDAIFAEMDELVLELVPDPTSLGPGYFRDLIATCRNYLNRSGLVLNELNREKLTVSSALRRLEAAYALASDDLLANDQSVRSLGAIDDRLATVGFLLRERKSEINEHKDRLHTLDSVYKVVNFRTRELHATMTAIKDQSRIMASEIRSGSFYGDERTGSPADEVSEQELADLLSDTPVEEIVAQVETPVVVEHTTTDEPILVESEESAVQRFLGDAPVSAQPTISSGEDDEFTSLLEGL